MAVFTIVHASRLLDVARALRESPKPEAFTMRHYAHWGNGTHPCGTPACALGHYALRPDLQQACFLERTPGTVSVLFKAEVFEHIEDRYNLRGYDCAAAVEWFGVNWGSLHDIFSPSGCGSAQTVEQAAEYIEAFVVKQFETTQSLQLAAFRDMVEATKRAQPAPAL